MVEMRGGFVRWHGGARLLVRRKQMGLGHDDQYAALLNRKRLYPTNPNPNPNPDPDPDPTPNPNGAVHGGRCVVRGPMSEV